MSLMQNSNKYLNLDIKSNENDPSCIQDNFNSKLKKQKYLISQQGEVNALHVLSIKEQLLYSAVVQQSSKMKMTSHVSRSLNLLLSINTSSSSTSRQYFIDFGTGINSYLSSVRNVIYVLENLVLWKSQSEPARWKYCSVLLL